MTRRNKKLLIIALVLCIISMVFSGLIQRDFGRVEMTDISLRTEVGTFTGYLFKPYKATSDNPAPAIVTSHGYLNNREMQDGNWIELARRGYVVFAMDAYNHGDSSVIEEPFLDTINARSGGMVDAVEYLYDLPFVDSTRIGVTGHSMGGSYADATMEYYSKLQMDAIESGMHEEEARLLNKVESGLIIGNYPNNLADAQDTSGHSGYLSHLGVVGGKYDEFFGEFTKELLTSSTSHNLLAVQTGIEISGDIEEGKFYKNPDNNYLLAMYHPKEFHAWNHFSATTIGHTMDFFQETLGAANPIEASSQIWWLKEALNFLGLIGFFLFIIPFPDLLINLPFFAELGQNKPIALKAPEGKDKRKYWWTNILTGIFSAIILVPAVLVGYLLLVNKFWPQDTTGGIGLWAAITGIISLAMIRLGYGKKIKGHWNEFGLKLSKSQFLKTLLLGFLVVSGSYILVFIADYFFKTDFRLWTFCIRVFSGDKIWVAIKYLPLFAIYYIINSIAISRSNFIGWSERKQIFIVALFNIIAPMIIIIITYLPVIWLGQTPWSILPGMIAGAMALIPIVLIPFVPILAIAAFIAVKSYKLTGRIWLGAFINTFMITMITVANTSFRFPY